MDNTDNEGNIGLEEIEADRKRTEDLVSGNPEKQASPEDQTSSSLSKEERQVDPVKKPIESHPVTPPDEIQGQGPQTRSQGTQSLMGLQALEGMNKMRLEGKKMEKLVKDMDEKKGTAAHGKSDIHPSSKVQDNNAQKVPEMKSETAGSGSQQKPSSQTNNREEQSGSEAEESSSSAGKRFPLVQFPLPERLSNLSETAIKKVSDALRLRGVNIKDVKAIVRYLQHHLSKCETRKRYRCLSEMENKLVWPVGSLGQEDQVCQFFDDVHAFLKYLDENEMKTHRKRIIKIVFKKLPKEIKYSMDQFLLASKSQSLSSLKRIIFSSRHNLPTKDTGEQNANKNYKQMHKPKPNLRRMEHNNPAPHKPQDTAKTLADVNRLGDDATSIKLQMFDVNQKKFSPVKGITDTGSDLNMANLQKLKPYILSSDEPRKIKNIRFPNNALVKVVKVCRARVQLIQGTFKLNLGEILFFVVDSPTWNDVIIGRNILNAHGVSLNLQDAPNTEKFE
eukprot:augustus_masked-scaffold_7-processed-gene-8.2-mRNA-1 protein AED:1.00 eAED:1.00 QI:0/0/0/0/1/1/5/0/504